MGQKMDEFWRWTGKFHSQAVPIIGPGSGGVLMRTSPRVLAGMASKALTTSPEEREKERREILFSSCEEALEAESHDFHRMRQIVSPEEFCAIVNAQSWEGMTWEDVTALMERASETVELE